MKRVVVVSLACSLMIAIGGCAASGGRGGGGGSRDAGPGGSPMDGSTPVRIDGGDPFVHRDASRALPPDPSAFFAMDPPPRYCGPGDGGVATPPGGTPECPDDRAREGCRCDTPGDSAPCWPGLRVDRNRGICHDGTAMCEPYDEFGGAWGPCMGAVLPTEGATRGREACNCFSAGRWEIDNLSPCFITYGTAVYAVSTYIDPGSGMAMCPTPSMMPPPAPEPGTDWSTDRLRVDCAGMFRLCYTLKAGNVMTPLPGDCTVAQVCTDAWYPTEDVVQELPPLPSWMSADSMCAGQFNSTGGYGEMSVSGLSIECDPVGDTAGTPYVFNRVGYCPTSCAMTPTLPACMACGMGGSGMF